MFYTFQAILIFALQFLRDFLLEAIIFIIKSFKIAKLRYVIM